MSTLNFEEVLIRSDIHFETTEINGRLYYKPDNSPVLLAFHTYSQMKQHPNPFSLNTENRRVIHLYEDIWNNRSAQVISRIKSIIGQNNRIYARSCELKQIRKPEALDFFEQNHLMGSTGIDRIYALEYQNEIVTALAIGKSRVMKDSARLYRSYEIIRFASKSGLTVVGGFSKLFRYLIQSVHPEHVMTYIDQDWSNGESFIQSGFIQAGKTGPIPFLINPETHLRKPLKTNTGNEPECNEFVSYSNGNLKLVFYGSTYIKNQAEHD